MIEIPRGVARIFQRGGHRGYSPDHHLGIADFFGLYRCFPSCISGFSRIIAAWRPLLTKDKSRWRKYFTKKQILKKVGFSTMAFTAKILSWRFRHLNIVGCLLKRRPTKGGSRAPQNLPLATLLIPIVEPRHNSQTLPTLWPIRVCKVSNRFFSLKKLWEDLNLLRHHQTFHFRRHITVTLVQTLACHVCLACEPQTYFRSSLLFLREQFENFGG